MDLPLDVFKYIISDYRTLLAFRCTCRDAVGATAAVKITIRSCFRSSLRRLVTGDSIDPPGCKYLRVSHFAPVVFDQRASGADVYFGGQYALSLGLLDDDVGEFAKLAALADYEYAPFSGTPMSDTKKEYMDRTNRVKIVDGIVYLPPKMIVAYYDLD